MQTFFELAAVCGFQDYVCSKLVILDFSERRLLATTLLRRIPLDDGYYVNYGLPPLKITMTTLLVELGADSSGKQDFGASDCTIWYAESTIESNRGAVNDQSWKSDTEPREKTQDSMLIVPVLLEVLYLLLSAGATPDSSFLKIARQFAKAFPNDAASLLQKIQQPLTPFQERLARERHRKRFQDEPDSRKSCQSRVKRLHE